MAPDGPKSDFSLSNSDVEIIPISEAQRRMGGESRSGIYRALASGELRAVKRGRRTMIIADSIRQRIQRLNCARFGSSNGGK